MAAAAPPHVTFLGPDWVQVQSHATKEKIAFRLSGLCFANAHRDESGKPEGRVCFWVHRADGGVHSEPSGHPSIAARGEEDAILCQLYDALESKGVSDAILLHGRDETAFSVMIPKHVVSHTVEFDSAIGWNCTVQCCSGSFWIADSEQKGNESRERAISDFDEVTAMLAGIERKDAKKRSSTSESVGSASPKKNRSD